MKQKNLLLILIALAIVAVAAFVIYQLVYRGNSSTTGGTGQTGVLPNVTNQKFQPTLPAPSFSASGSSASSSKFGVVSNDPALDYFVDAANTVILVEPAGIIESISNGATSVMSSATVPNIINAAFSYDGKKVLITYSVATTTKTSVFDITSRSWIHLPDGMQSPVWSPSNYQIAYLAPSSSGSEKLATIDASAANAKPAIITSFAMEDMILQWPTKNGMVISDRPSAFTTGSVWLFTISSRTLSPVIYGALGPESLWGASGTALVFSAGPNSAGGQLSFRNATGSQNLLSFNTLPSKCVFGPPAATSAASTTTVPSSLFYCAAPDDQDTFSVARLPDEYEQKIYFTDDDFYSVNFSTGALNEIFSFSKANLDLDATRMKVFNNVLFFVNRYDQKVYALAL
jgi:hypothetical protein